MGEQKLTLKILGDAKSAVDALKKTSAEVKKTGSDTQTSSGAGSKAALAFGLSFAALGAAALAFGKDSVEAYMKSEVAQKRLASVVNATGASYDGMKGQINAALTSASDLSSFSKGDLRGALTRLTLATHDVNSAMGALPVTMDLMVAGQMDAEAAAKLVGKAWNGNATALKKMGIEIPAGLRGMDAINAIQEQVAGSAADYGTTTEASVRRANNAWNAFLVDFGGKIAPNVTDALTNMTDVMNGRWDAINKRGEQIVADDLIAAYKLKGATEEQARASLKGVEAANVEAVVTRLSALRKQEATQATTRYAASLREQRQAMQEAKDEAVSEQQADIDFQRAQLRKKEAVDASVKATKEARQAQRDYSKAVADHGPKSKQAADAQAKLAEKTKAAKTAELDAKQAMLDYMKAAEAAGKQLNQTDYKVLCQWLDNVKLKAQLAAEQIRSMTAAQAASSNIVQGYSAGDRPRARGGINPGVPERVLWGEDGAEAIIPLSQKYRAQANALIPQVLAMTGFGGGGVTVPVSIDARGLSAADAADAARSEVYRVLVEAGA